MNKTEQLNKLFDRWEASRKSYQNKFIRDGIINEIEFENSNSKRILFITKEPNDPKQTKWDFRDWWNEEIKYSFSSRIAEWAYGIENDFPVFSSIWEDNSTDKGMEALKKIAFMNIKKTGGTGKSNLKSLLKHLSSNEDKNKEFNFIREQIEIIQPKLIVLGLSWRELREFVFPEIKNKWIESGYDIPIARLKKYKIVDFYHPSSRNAPSAAYSLLQNVINSKAFQSL